MPASVDRGNPLLPGMNTYDQHGIRSMMTTEFISVSQKIYEETSDLKGSDRTFDEVIANLVGQAKKQQHEDDFRAIR